MRADLREQSIQYGLCLSIESEGSERDPCGYKRFLAECQAARALIPNPSFSRATYSVDGDDEGYVQILTLYFERTIEPPYIDYPAIAIIGKFHVSLSTEGDGESDRELWDAVMDAGFVGGV